jgi:hypothetical protein
MGVEGVAGDGQGNGAGSEQSQEKPEIRGHGERTKLATNFTNWHEFCIFSFVSLLQKGHFTAETQSTQRLC